MKRPSATLAGLGAVLASQISVNLGAACAKLLFAEINPLGVTALRVVFAACLLAMLRRPWRRVPPGATRPALILYGTMLAGMNLFIYQAFLRIPIGIAVGIEVTGPLVIVLLNSRRPRDFWWLALVAAGLALLLPLHVHSKLNPVGIAFALGAALCWALYIVSGKRVAGKLGADAVSWGMAVAALIVAPLGISVLHFSALRPWELGLALAVALLSSAVPYSLEMEAMKRLSSRAFSILLSAAPAIAALAGFVVLGESLTLLQWGAMLCIMAASAGSAMSVKSPVPPESFEV
ncbi:EamA family transporter [Acidocella aminolytica]|jgi:inner membrane transporter RhtA|uniref:Transporter EamA n=1 Tax=Acidocella aminolytica 101 = DSM 11237 TaxID=1120923 RepID=A0A0D6PGV6_9PROT|nr:EamA family transporter [Acidocella aminolytica]GAN80438.1 transporter EamA [Acidocella aminolytica 101 = DSM 11237]GBQ35774.1 putative drug/metabolite transporter superfamily permease [Acidocella aminolytica 101 = DSM 11237]SHE96512.1 inner membrane transporter RhtA [Acidocella aminolytica 101 = DSM 11237]